MLSTSSKRKSTPESGGLLIIKADGKRRAIPAAIIHHFSEQNDEKCTIELTGQGKYGRTCYQVGASFETLCDAFTRVKNGETVDLTPPPAPAPPQAPTIKARHVDLYPAATATP